jgi:hypothetical protein
MGGTCSLYGGKAEVHTGFWWGDLREGDHLGDPGVHGEDNIKIDVQEVGWRHGLDLAGSG